MITVSQALAIAIQHHEAGRLAEAATLCARIVEADPYCYDAVHLLGLLARRHGDANLAAARLRRALARRPDFGEALYNLGNLLRAEGGDSAAASVSLRRCVRLRPELGGVRHMLALSLYAAHGLKAIPEAVSHLKEAVRLEPGLVAAWSDLGVLLRLGGDTETAVAPLRRAVVLQPAFGQGWTGLGNAFSEQGRMAEAVAAFRRAVVLASESGEACFNLGNALYASGELEPAVAAYRQAIDFGARIAECRLAAALSELGRLAEAETELVKVLGRPDGDIASALEIYCAVLLRQGRRAEALAFFSSYQPPPGAEPVRGECLTAIAEIHLWEGRPAEAAALLAPVVGDRGRFFTVKSIAFLRRSLEAVGAVLPERRPSDPHRPRIASSTLATHGRFAHNVLEYILLRLYAETNGLTLETPDWVGHCVFALDDPLYDDRRLRPALFPRAALNAGVDGSGGATPDGPAELADRDLLSPLWLFEHRVRHRERVRSWLTVRPEWSPWLTPLNAGLAARGRTVVALHLRRGDFVYANYPISQTAWYVAWLRSIWAGLDAPVLYLASDDLKAVKADFAEFAPVSLDDLTEPWTGLEFLQDFHVLMTADVVGVSARSGFSLLAALLNTRAGLFVEPDPDSGAIRPFAPWTP